MAQEFNYGQAELAKLPSDAYIRKVKFVANSAGGDVTGETRWLNLTPEQYAQVRELIISFEL